MPISPTVKIRYEKMKISETDLRIPSQETVTDYARLVNWIIRMRVVGAPNHQSYFQYQMAKVPAWDSLAIETLEDSVDNFVQGLLNCGATSLVAISLPFYVTDGSIFAYEGAVTAEHVRDVLRGWAPYDYAIVGVATVNDESTIVALASIIYDEVVVLAGPRSFLALSVGDVEASRLAFAAFAAREERRSDLRSISRAVTSYSDQLDWNSILFPE